MSPELLLFIAKTAIAALVIAGASSLAQKSPAAAGYLTALPLATILALTFTQVQGRDDAATVKYALSVLVSIPVSLVFFVPFLFYGRLKGPFWAYMAVGVALLYAGSFVQRVLAARLLG